VNSLEAKPLVHEFHHIPHLYRFYYVTEAVANSFRQTVKFISFRHKLLYDAEA